MKFHGSKEPGFRYQGEIKDKSHWQSRLPLASLRALQGSESVGGCSSDELCLTTLTFMGFFELPSTIITNRVDEVVMGK